MAIETGLRGLLASQSTITSLVSSQLVGGIRYPSIFNEYADQGIDPPFIIVAKTDLEPWLTLGTSLGTHPTEFDIDCYATSHPQALAIAAAVKAFLEDYTGPAGSDNTIKAVLWEGGRYDVVHVEQGTDVRQHIESLSFTLQHT